MREGAYGSLGEEQLDARDHHSREWKTFAVFDHRHFGHFQIQAGKLVSPLPCSAVTPS